MFLTELFSKNKIAALVEGGNLSSQSPGWQGMPGDHEAQEIDLKLHNRDFMVDQIRSLLQAQNESFAQAYGRPIWDPKLVASNKMFSGSSLQFFDVKSVSTQDFINKLKKVKVGDIDTQVDQEIGEEITAWLKSIVGKKIGNGTFVGFNSSLSALWQLNDPPVKIQIDYELGPYEPAKGKEPAQPTEWFAYSHSSDYADMEQGIKGVFHKYINRALTHAQSSTKYVARVLKKSVKISPEPVTDSDFSFAVTSAQGGGLSAKYKPYVDPQTGQPMEIDGIPVMQLLDPSQRDYIQNLDQQFQQFYGKKRTANDKKLQNSFVGTMQLMNGSFTPDQNDAVARAFLNILFAPGAQMITADDPERDRDTKFAAVDWMIEHLKLPNAQGLRQEAVQMAMDYESAFNAKKATKSLKENFTDDRDSQNKECPPATQDIKLNLKNRQKAIDEYGYGPLNPDLPNTKFWMKKVDEWNLDSVEEAKQSLCGNCAAFDQRQDTLNCIAQGIDSVQEEEDPTIEAGDLGYCRFLKFKCASRRTCDAWVTGGPLTDNFKENFADGRNPQDKGDSKRYGINTKASVSSLRKTAKQGGRKGQLAHWLANMKAGRAKKHENISEAEVKAQLRKGMPHLRDLKPADFLDLLDEIHDGNGNFTLQDIPLNVKVDGFGGRFGKNADGQPFMATSRTEPRYQAGFLDYHKQKGTTDPDVLRRAGLFDDLFNEMMQAVDMVDEQLGPDFLVNKQVTCEVLFAPFATETPEGKLKFVGIEYDALPQGVELVLVPYRIVDATTGEDDPDTEQALKAMTGLGSQGKVMFMSNRLAQKQGLDVTAIIPPLENLEELKQIVGDTAGKRDRASLQLRKEVEAKLKPIQIELEKAIDEDPNIVGKDMLGQDYEGIVINSRLGPIKVTSQRQKDIITAKNAAKAAARAEQPRENQNKTAVVAIGSFVGHIGHEQLWDYTVKKAAELGGDPYLFIGNAQGKDDPIPPAVKVQTWHKMYPEYAKNISTVTQEGGSLIQKIKHELINPLPGKPPRYDNIIIMVGEDQAGLSMPQALMKAVNKFQGYEHVKVSLEPTPRGTGMSFTKLRNILKDPNATPEAQYAEWAKGFDEAKLGKDWILHLMDITRKGMGIQQPQKQPVAERLLNALVRPKLTENGSMNTDSTSPFTSVINPMGDRGWWEDEEASEGSGSRRMSAAVKLQRAFDRERAKSDASRRRGEEVMAQAKADAEKKSKEQGVTEGNSGARYKVKSIGHDSKGDYYISPSTGKKTYKKARVGDHEVPGSKEIKPKLKEAYKKLSAGEKLSKAVARQAQKDKDARTGLSGLDFEKHKLELQALGNRLKSKDRDTKEAMLPVSSFVGSKKNKLGTAGQLKGNMKRPARAGDLVGGAEEGIENEDQRLDAHCWKGYRKAGTKMKGGTRVNNCVPVSESVENKIASLIEVLKSK